MDNYELKSFYNKNRKVLINYMELYFSQKPTDCTFYSVDGYEFPIHKVSFQISNVSL